MSATVKISQPFFKHGWVKWIDIQSKDYPVETTLIIIDVL